MEDDKSYIFTVTVSLPTQLQCFFEDGTIKYLAELDRDCDREHCVELVKIKLITEAVYALYSRDLVFQKLESSQNKVFAHFKNSDGRFIYFYGYFDCQNSIPKFIIHQEYDCVQDVQSLHLTK